MPFRPARAPSRSSTASATGPAWIADQTELQFGLQGRYLVDFYHLCEYLAPAAERIDTGKKARHGKTETKDERERVHGGASRLAAVSGARHRSGFRCARTRMPPLYHQPARSGNSTIKRAIQCGLPTGSGKVEGSHRYVIQARLKISGAWWKIDNAAKMLALRVCGTNSKWDAYWGKLYQHVT